MRKRKWWWWWQWYWNFIQKGQAYSILNKHKNIVKYLIDPPHIRVWVLLYQHTCRWVVRFRGLALVALSHCMHCEEFLLSQSDDLWWYWSVAWYSPPKSCKKKKKEKKKCPDLDGLRREKQYNIPPVFSWMVMQGVLEMTSAPHARPHLP